MSPATCYLCAMKARENKYRSDWTLNNKMRKTWGNKPGQPIPTVLVLSHSSLSITKRVSFDKIRLMVLLRKHKPGRWPPRLVHCGPSVTRSLNHYLYLTPGAGQSSDPTARSDESRRGDEGKVGSWQSMSFSTETFDFLAVEG